MIFGKFLAIFHFISFVEHFSRSDFTLNHASGARSEANVFTARVLLTMNFILIDLSAI